MMMEQKTKKVGRQVRNPTRNQKEPGNGDGIECQNSRETSPGTLSGARTNQQVMMEQNAKRVGRQTPEPYPEPEKASK